MSEWSASSLRARGFQESVAPTGSSHPLQTVSSRASSYSCGIVTWDWGPTIPVYAVPPLAGVRITSERVHVKGNLPAFAFVSAIGLLVGLFWVRMYGYIVAGVAFFGYFVMPRRKYQTADLQARWERGWFGVGGLWLETRGGTLRAGLWGWNARRIAQALAEHGVQATGASSAWPQSR